MGDNLTRKILREHLARPSEMNVGEEIEVKVDQTLTHDINAVMCYLAFEGVGVDRVDTEVSVSYLDHNLIYIDNKTPDDHIFLQTLAKRYGIWVSRPGNGIMHSIQMARFGIPGKISLGTDSHTPTGGAIGMFAFGGGGMDGATAMAGLPIRLTMPEVVKVNLIGELRPGVAAKDVILEMLRRYSTKGGLGKVYEYVGEGIKTLDVPARSTITNMGAELGATGSIFPADENVRRFFTAQEREGDFIAYMPDEDAEYDSEIEINLSDLEPLIAIPDQPDNVVKVSELEKEPVQQVFFGSCTNGSYEDIAKAASVFKGRQVHENVSAVCGIATKQIYQSLLKDGYIDILLDAGVRLLEIACGPCCGIGQSPATNSISVRTSNRNFKGRSGNPNAQLYLVGPETAAATAIMGTFATAQDVMGDAVVELGKIKEPDSYPINDDMLIPPLPLEEAMQVEIIRGPNIQPLPIPDPPLERLEVEISIKTGDNITTDDITPASAEFSSMRSNIPLMSQYCYLNYDPTFAQRAKELGKSIIVGGENYGQGSSREHAAINPMYLGVKAVIAKSMARIHRNNLINHGVVPLTFERVEDYNLLEQGDRLVIERFAEEIPHGRITIEVPEKGLEFTGLLEATETEIEVILDGGQLRHMRKKVQSKQ